MVQDTGGHVNVDGFVSTLGTVAKVHICTMAVSYDCPATLQTYVLFFPQALYIKGMRTNLLSPFQLRDFGVTINDTPLQHLSPEARSDTQHCIQVGDLLIPLELNGTMSGFPTRKPTALEVQDNSGANGVHIYMTSEAPWEPHSSLHGDIESTLWDSLNMPRSTSQLSPLQVRGLSEAEEQLEVEAMPFYCDLPPNPRAKDQCPRPPSTVYQCISSITATRASVALDVDSYADTLLHGETTGKLGPMLAPVTSVKKRKGFVDASKLAANWKIGLELARQTVSATTQRAATAHQRLDLLPFGIGQRHSVRVCQRSGSNCGILGRGGQDGSGFKFRHSVSPLGCWPFSN